MWVINFLMGKYIHALSEFKRILPVRVYHIFEYTLATIIVNRTKILMSNCHKTVIIYKIP